MPAPVRISVGGELETAAGRIVLERSGGLGQERRRSKGGKEGC